MRNVSSFNAMKTTIGGCIQLSQATIPSIFDGCWDAKFSHYRVIDFLDFLLHVVPTIVLDRLEDESAKAALMFLIDTCSIALQWEISEDDLDIMNSYFEKWHDFLREAIAEGALNERVFTFNNHYLCHLKFLIRRMGPLRAYTCRPLERSIKVFTNLIKATTNVAVNTSNIFRRHQNYRRYAIHQLQDKHFPPKQYDPASYRVHPDAGATESNWGELWAPFKPQTIRPRHARASSSSDRYTVYVLV